MNEDFWVFGELDKRYGQNNHIEKSPDGISDLIRKLRHKRKDNITLTPKVMQKDNWFEFYTEYDTGKKKIAERYMFLVAVETPAENISQIANLAKGFEDCENDDERKLWLRIAAPVVDSAKILSQFHIPNKISNTYLQKHKLKIMKKAHERKIMYHVFSRYCDAEQVLTDLALQYAF